MNYTWQPSVETRRKRDHRGKKEEKGLSPKEAQNNLLVWVQSLMSQGYTIHDIKRMRLSDFDLMVQALETKESQEEEETTLDKAFPFLFG